MATVGNDADCAAVAGSIRSTRLLKSLTLKELADRAGCSESVLSKIENVRISPSLPMLQRIARALDVTLAALVSVMDQSQVVSRAGQRDSVGVDRCGSRVERLVPANGEHMLEGHLHRLMVCLERAVAGLTADGVRCDWLDTSHAFHSALLDPALDAFETFADQFTFAAPQRILVCNRTGAALGRTAKLDGAYWRRHARQPVEFA